MVFAGLLLDYIPMNPEKALGYYLSTTKHNNSKIETMKDCITIEMLCDEFSMFYDGEINDIPEGIIAEIMLWKKIDRNKEIKKFRYKCFNELEIIENFNFIKTFTNNKNLITKYLKKENIDDTLKNLDSEVEKDIKERLLDECPRCLRLPGYISMESSDMKYYDWARNLIYDEKYVPILPNLLIDSFIINSVYGENSVIEFMKIRMNILKKINDIWFILKPNKLNKNITTLDINVAMDLFVWLKNKERINARFLSWDELKIPKFINKNWAITNKERLIIHGE